MKETKAKNLTMFGLNKESTPLQVRVLPKKPGTSVKEVPSGGWSVYLHSTRVSTQDEWKNMAEAFMNQGFNAKVHNESLTVW